MKVYRVIEEDFDYGEYNEYWRKSFISLDDAELYKLKCEQEEYELEELSFKCDMCKYGFGNRPPCADFEAFDNNCNNYFAQYIKSTFRIDEEEVE